MTIIDLEIPMMQKIIGRKKEQKQLDQYYGSSKSEFIVIYGRRRVGKTFLIRKTFEDKYAFQATGLSRGDTAVQINNFHTALCRSAPKLLSKSPPKTWIAAFDFLREHLEQLPTKRKVVFIDELSWMDTPRSGFLTALEHFWNGWAAHQDDILLIGCGSVTSWMINKLINNRGGLHNRVTGRIHLNPFNLKEVQAFLNMKGTHYDQHQLIQLYMAMGGIPYYLDQIDPSKSVAQNIDRLFFETTGLLRSEFNNLYRSLFKNSENHVSIIKALSSRAQGLTKQEISKLSKIKTGGTLTDILEELEQCGFIKEYLPFGKKKRGALYQLKDFYSLFYLKFIEGQKAAGDGAWMTQIDHPKWRSWSGYAFENICFHHIDELKKGLGIGSVYTEISSWTSNETSTRKGAQIDLVIDRRDRVINLCEMKFSEGDYVITKSYAETLQQKVKTFREATKTRKTLMLTMITLYGMKKNQHSINQVQSNIAVGDLFFK